MVLRWSLPLAILGLMAVPASAADQSVTTTSGNDFSPAEVTVDIGDTVTWSNGARGFHNVHFDDGSFEDPPSPDVSDWTVERTFDTPGTYRYHCEFHGGPDGAGMSGTVGVRDATGTVPEPVEHAPGLTVSARRQQSLRRLVKGDGLRVKARCENGCDATLKLTLGASTAKRLGFRRRRTAIGSEKAAIPADHTEAIDIALTRKAKRKLGKADRPFKVRLDVRATKDTSETARRTIEIKP